MFLFEQKEQEGIGKHFHQNLTYTPRLRINKVAHTYGYAYTSSSHIKGVGYNTAIGQKLQLQNMLSRSRRNNSHRDSKTFESST